MANKNPSPKTRFENKGEGIGGEVKAISVKFSPSADEILRSLENRSEYIRNAVLKQMKEDGLLPLDTK